MISSIKQNQNEYDISNRLYSLLCNISKKNQNHESKKADIIETAKKFIISNYHENISVNDISAAANMSASYFSKLFKKSTGFSPYDYLLTVRLDRAKELLRQTDDSIESVACKTGFNSESNFIYFFKKETGVSTLKFRKIKF